MKQQERPIIQLRAWRTYRNLTQQELADRSGLSQWQVSRYENGHAGPWQSSAAKLAKALGCEPWQLYAVPEPMTGLMSAAERIPPRPDED